jgi:hypothetical protein
MSGLIGLQWVMALISFCGPWNTECISVLAWCVAGLGAILWVMSFVV